MIGLANLLVNGFVKASPTIVEVVEPTLINGSLLIIRLALATADLIYSESNLNGELKYIKQQIIIKLIEIFYILICLLIY
jgi:hypothetical protein